MTGKGRRPATARSSGPPLRAVLGHGELGESLMFSFPLLIIYGVGVMLLPSAGNGVDFMSRWIFQALGYSQRNYLLFYAGLTAIFAVVMWRLMRGGHLRPGRFAMTLVEATIFALTLGSFIFFVMEKVLGMGVPELGVAGRVVASFGAGIHEELVFRLGLFAGGAALLRVVGVPHRTAMIVAAVLSSLAFSAVHHLGAYGDPWVLRIFVNRTLAGLVLAGVFYFRSFATAAWGHALYDVYVMVFLQAY
jgi:hypothetical protein